MSIADFREGNRERLNTLPVPVAFGEEMREPVETETRDDEALSSLLLLLKSTSKSNQDNNDDFQLRDEGRSHENYRRQQSMMPSTRLDIDISTLRQCFHLPLAQAAKCLGTCTTSLKKICRKHNIERWPCRQIKSLTKTLHSIQRACLNINLPPNVRLQYIDEIRDLEKALIDITRDPNTDISHLIITKKRANKRTNPGDDNDSDSDLDGNDETEVRATSPSEFGFSDTQGTLLPNPPDIDPDDPTLCAPDNSAQDDGSERLNVGGENSAATEGGGASNADAAGGGEPPAKKKRNSTKRYLKRGETTYDKQTGWIAGCSRCGKLGKYRSPSEGRPFQHSTGMGRYCGYYRLNPRRGYTQGFRSRRPDYYSHPFDASMQFSHMIPTDSIVGLRPMMLPSFSGAAHTMLHAPPRPPVAGMSSIGISGTGGMVQPLTVHDGMVDPFMTHRQLPHSSGTRSDGPVGYLSYPYMSGAFGGPIGVDDSSDSSMYPLQTMFRSEMAPHPLPPHETSSSSMSLPSPATGYPHNQFNAYPTVRPQQSPRGYSTLIPEDEPLSSTALLTSALTNALISPQDRRKPTEPAAPTPFAPLSIEAIRGSMPVRLPVSLPGATVDVSSSEESADEESSQPKEQTQQQPGAPTFPARETASAVPQPSVSADELQGLPEASRRVYPSELHESTVI